jgi:azurin
MKLAERTRVLVPGERISVGFDGSYARDATVITACTMDGHIFLIRAW